jgi:tetratricopeptide (TPR) repeat protein
MHDEAVALVERLRGPDHPQTAMVLGNRVHSLSMLARKDEARSSLNRVLAIRRAVFGPDAPVVGEAHRQIGDAERASGNLDAAATQFEEALAIHRRAQDDVGTFFDLANFGEMRLEQGQTAEAARFMDEALTHGERAFGADSLRVAQLLVNRSGISVADGQPAAAVAQIERALAIFGAELPADDLTTGVARLALGRAYVLSGRADEGLASFEDGARIVLAKFPQRHPQRVALARAHAELLVEAKRPEAALARLREAAGIADEILAADDAERGGVWEDLAARLEAAGRGREASAARERARAASP